MKIKLLKLFTILIIYFSPVILIFLSIVIFTNVINSDLYGRLIETKQLKLINSEKENVENSPTITLILHKYLADESAIESSLAITYRKDSMLKKFKTDSLELMIKFMDGYTNTPNGISNKFIFNDNIKTKNQGESYLGNETQRFSIPTLPSIKGFPYDDVMIKPIISLYINGVYTKMNFQIQKRIPGRTLSFSKNAVEVILTRTSTEKYLVIISSLIFLLTTIILTFVIILNKKGLNTIEELIAVASYILATAGFKEILGINRDNGTSTLEIYVILIPLILIFIGLIVSVYKSIKYKKLNKTSINQ